MKMNSENQWRMFLEYKTAYARPCASAEEGAGLRNGLLCEWRGSSSNSAYMLRRSTGLGFATFCLCEYATAKRHICAERCTRFCKKLQK